jgi:hypothetical protein
MSRLDHGQEATMIPQTDRSTEGSGGHDRRVIASRVSLWGSCSGREAIDVSLRNDETMEA